MVQINPFSWFQLQIANRPLSCLGRLLQTSWQIAEKVRWRPRERERADFLTPQVSSCFSSSCSSSCLHPTPPPPSAHLMQWKSLWAYFRDKELELELSPPLRLTDCCCQLFQQNTHTLFQMLFRNNANEDLDKSDKRQMIVHHRVTKVNTQICSKDTNSSNLQQTAIKHNDALIKSFIACVDYW